jgi:hypothetical protein
LSRSPTRESPGGILDILLVDFRTGESHPQARNPVIVIGTLPEGGKNPIINIEIVGENLALAVYIPGEDDRDDHSRNLLYVFDWKLGLRKLVGVPPGLCLGFFYSPFNPIHRAQSLSKMLDSTSWRRI